MILIFNITLYLILVMKVLKNKHFLEIYTTCELKIILQNMQNILQSKLKSAWHCSS